MVDLMQPTSIARWSNLHATFVKENLWRRPLPPLQNLHLFFGLIAAGERRRAEGGKVMCWFCSSHVLSNPLDHHRMVYECQLLLQLNGP